MEAPSRRRLSWLLLAACSCMPGCFTRMLWGVGEPELVETDRSEVHRDVELAVAVGNLGAQGLSAREQPADAVEAHNWFLRPGPGADTALTLLHEPQLFHVTGMSLDAERHLVGEEVPQDTATLTLRGTFDRELIVSTIGEAELSPEARHVLAEDRWNAFAFAADPWLFLPMVFRQCVHRLAAIDLQSLLGAAAPVQVESFVFVGERGQPRFEPDAAVAPTPPDADNAELPLAPRLALLRDLMLVLRVRCGSETSYLRVRPDRLWLLGSTETEPGGVIHRSTWSLEPEVAALTPCDARRWQGQLDLRLVHFAWMTPQTKLPIVVRILLTPLAVVADVPGWLLQSWLDSDDDDSGSQPQPRGR